MNQDVLRVIIRMDYNVKYVPMVVLDVIVIVMINVLHVIINITSYKVNV